MINPQLSETENFLKWNKKLKKIFHEVSYVPITSFLSRRIFYIFLIFL